MFGNLPGRSVRRAFTLVELMVVVSIISVLIGILLPALGRSRDAARSVACSAQARSLATVSTLYADDHAGVLPRSTHSAFAAGSAPWGYALLPYLDQQGEVAPGDASTQARYMAAERDRYRCPFDRERTRGPTYILNVYYELDRTETGGPTWRRLERLDRPSSTVLFGEADEKSTADHAMAHFWTQFNAEPEADQDRHGRPGGGVGYADTHAVITPFATTFSESERVNQWDPAIAR